MLLIHPAWFYFKIAAKTPSCLKIFDPYLLSNSLTNTNHTYNPLHNNILAGNPGSVFRKEDQVDLLHEEEVLKIGQKHGVTAGQVLIRYQVDKGIV